MLQARGMKPGHKDSPDARGYRVYTRMMVGQSAHVTCKLLLTPSINVRRYTRYAESMSRAFGQALRGGRALLTIDVESECKDVQRLVVKRLRDVDAKLADLKRVRAALADALERCRTSRQGCPVVTDLKNARVRSERS